MSEIDELERDVTRFQAKADLDRVDPARLAAVIDSIQGTLSTVLHRAKTRGDHLLAGQSACSWAAAQCRMSRTSAADRLCVGEQLENLPRVGRALSSGDIGYQSAAVICHLSDQLGEKRDCIDEAQWIAFAQRFSIKDLRYLASEARMRWDPDGAERHAAEKFELRSLDISETLHGMYRLDGWLDPVGGAAFKAAIESLSRPLGPDDGRSSRQRRA
ncbi:MAG TPA: DUF222 domain-containing protein, partial [Candidatus Dormibacteraeota bacterium]|nr:DUF222 domain-containing protein [Candidatus Dormibacteraeota bacterium]